MKICDVLSQMHWLEVTNAGWQQFRKIALREYGDIGAATSAIDLVDAICTALK